MGPFEEKALQALLPIPRRPSCGFRVSSEFYTSSPSPHLEDRFLFSFPCCSPQVASETSACPFQFISTRSKNLKESVAIRVKRALFVLYSVEEKVLRTSL
ncbi:hypothetical protein AVEN_199806-1 [Araneus ventricosus]|uniref:Uncharacterized protein n=1 Tax=Araneus ventricosus TaxID=182803 RepID=A0A4Y2JCL3_ARAVE|nr:hypothetical protein AVEN_199806-1 [Araneus ventricosus]